MCNSYLGIEGLGFEHTLLWYTLLRYFVSFYELTIKGHKKPKRMQRTACFVLFLLVNIFQLLLLA